MKIGITERGDPSLDFSWKEKINDMDGVIFVTKNLTDKLIEETTPYWDKIIFHITCTGYGGTVVEPNIPAFDKQLSQALKLVTVKSPESPLRKGWDEWGSFLKNLPLFKKKI